MNVDNIDVELTERMRFYALYRGAIYAVTRIMKEKHPALWQSLLEGNPLPGTWQTLDDQARRAAYACYTEVEPGGKQILPLGLFAGLVCNAVYALADEAAAQK